MFALTKRGCAGALFDKQFLQHQHDGESLSLWLDQTNSKYRKLEGAKTVFYNALVRHQIPIPYSQPFKNWNDLQSLLTNQPTVIKFDTTSMLGPQTVISRSADNLDHIHQTATALGSCQGLVQTFIQGKEYTVTVAVGDQNWVHLGSAVDYKRRYNYDQGLNTFGMGSIAPCSYVADTTDTIIDKVVDLLKQRFRYHGMLSCQFILDCNGRPWLMEFNPRLCDPEFQSMAQRLDQDLVDVCRAMQQGQYLVTPKQQPVNAVTVGLIHRDWPRPQPQRQDIDIQCCDFVVSKMQGSWDSNTYWGTITHSGPKSHQDLANEIYSYLQQIDCRPFEYRLDIGQ